MIGPALAAFMIATAQAGSQGNDSLRSPFSGFETRILPNGLKVWYRHAPDLPDVAVSVTVPYGWDQDPDGYKQLAHFTEHMLFTDRSGMSELELKTAMDRRGGSRNGMTYDDHTAYIARVRSEHGAFALRWIHTLLTPPLLRPDLIERQRTPVMLEVNARAPGPLEKLGAMVVNPPMLRPPGYWRREFDLPSEWERRDSNWEGIQRMDSASVREFLDRYYVPSRMTLTITGAIAPDSVWAIVAQTYALIPPGRAPPPLPGPRDPERERRSFSWGFQPNVSVSYRFKSYQPSARDEVVAMFLASYLSRRLNEQLRFGPRKAVYGVSASRRARGRASEFTISANVRKSEYAFARGVIEKEIAALRDGTVSDSAFVRGRDVAVAMMRTSYNTAAAIDGLVVGSLYARDVHADFPDLVKEFESLTRTDAVRHAGRLFDRSRQVTSVLDTAPLSESVLIMIGLLVAAVAFLLARALLIRPLPMASLRYVARIRRPIAHRIVFTALIAIASIFVLRVAFAPLHALYVSSLVQLPSFYVQWSLLAIAALVPIMALIGIRAWIPAKVLVFEHGVAIKAHGFRSEFIPDAEIAEASLTDLSGLYRRIGLRGLVRTRIMTPALLSPAVFLAQRDGRSWLFRSRDTAELMAAIELASGAGAENV